MWPDQLILGQPADLCSNACDQDLFNLPLLLDEAKAIEDVVGPAGRGVALTTELWRVSAGC